MSVFLERNHLFLRDPRGGVEDVASMKAAGFGAIFCNVGDHDPEEWATVRDRARAAGVVCGPWLRTADASGSFDDSRLLDLLDVAHEWGSPVIVNSETELKGTDDNVTGYIADVCRGYDAALSTEPWPYDNVDWSPLRELPVLPQVFGQRWGQDAEDCRWQWQNVEGFRCVVFTFGTYSGWTPTLYDLLSPYGLYTADDCGNVFAPWSAKGHREPCVQTPIPPTNGGSDVQTIGNQDGIAAATNRLRDLDPAGTLLVKAGGKWPDLSTLTQPVKDWKGYDKLQRTLQILKDDHDGGAA